MTQLNAAITWLGHSTFLVETPGGKRVLFEAFLGSSPTCPAEYHQLDSLDLMLLTHGHGDHVADAITTQQRTNCTIAGMVELMGWIGSKGAPADKLIDFNKGGTIEFEGLKVTMVDAKHSASTPDGTYAGEPAGFVLELEDGYRIYHAGDTCVFGDMRLIAELYAPDLAILPIGGHYTMDPRQAAKAVELLGVKDVLGMHYGTFPPLKGTPAQLREFVGSGVTVHELQPGETLGKVAAHA